MGDEKEEEEKRERIHRHVCVCERDIIIIMTSEQQQQQQQQQQKQRPGLTGEQLEDYCLQHGLCPLCAKTTTHQRRQIGPTRLKLNSSNQNQRNSQQNQQHIWYPLTVTTLNDTTVDTVVVHNGKSGDGSGGGTRSGSDRNDNGSGGTRGIVQTPKDVSEAVSKFNQFREIHSLKQPQSTTNTNSGTTTTTTTKKKKKAGFFSS